MNIQTLEPPSAVLVSALTGDGLNALEDQIESALLSGRVTVDVALAPKDGEARAWLHENAVIEAESFSNTGETLISASMSLKDYGRWETRFAKMV